MSQPALGTLELAILLAVVRLGNEAYGLGIRSDVSARLDHDYSVGAIYTTLQRLEERKLVSSYTTDPLPVRGGRSRRQFQITAAGKKAVVQAQRVAESVWGGIGTNITPTTI